jgi:hypothetical protein
MKEKIIVPFLIALFFIVMVVMAFVAPGTADTGDSVGHFLFARYAFNYPEHFFDPWAKPLYVLLAAPLAQYGFKGIKLFNVIVSTITMTACYLTAKRLRLSNSWLVVVFLALAPMNIINTLSGLTEPLFACLLISGLCLLFYEKNVAGLIVLSFLPFVRSEGLFMLLPVAVYLIMLKKPFSILWLALGQIVYAIAGYFFYKNILWFYIQNPYHFISQYGQGRLNTFVVNMPVIIGFPLSLLLGVGCITMAVYFIRKRKLRTESGDSFLYLLLVWCLFALFFLFHSFSWWLGLFSSFGMLRYMIAVIPLIAIICLFGYNKITALFFPKYNPKIVNAISLVFIIIPTFLRIPQKVNYYKWNKDFGLHSDQITDEKLADYMKQKYPDYRNRTIFFDATYLAVALDVDPFNEEKHKWHVNNYDTLSPGSLYIWDDWFSVVEGQVSLQQLTNDTALVRDTSFSQPNEDGNPRIVVLFRKK